MLSDRNVSFHESTILDIQHNGDTVVLKLEGVQAGAAKTSGFLYISGIRSLECDGTNIQSFGSELIDSEILTLNLGESRLLLIVECTDFATRNSLIHCYSSLYDAVGFRHAGD